MKTAPSRRGETGCTKLSGISPKKRPSIPPREYKAQLDLLRVRDCLWQRMRPSQIAKRLGKDKAWVSRAIRKIHEDSATAFCGADESEIVQEHLAQLQSLAAKALRLANQSKDAKQQLIAIRTAADVIRQRGEYQMAVGFVQKRDTKGHAAPSKGDAFLESLKEELPPDAAAAALEKLIELRKQPRLFKPQRATTPT